MRKMVVIMVMVLALVFSVSGIAVACEKSKCKCQTYIPVEFADPVASPPKGYKTSKTRIPDGSIEAGGITWNVFFWGSPGCPLDKAPAVQRWTRERWLPCNYKIMLPSEKAARDCRFNRTGALRDFLVIYKSELDKMPLEKASVGYQAYITLHPDQLRDAGLDP
jgi:hypothetical protein